MRTVFPALLTTLPVLTAGLGIGALALPLMVFLYSGVVK